MRRHVECTVSLESSVPYTRAYSGKPYLIVDATPPLRIVSGCSVKTTISDRGYSSSTVELSLIASGSTGRGVRKNDLPVEA